MVLFGSINTAMMEYFDDIYAAVAKTVAVVVTMAITTTGGGAGRAFQYQDFDNTKPLTFDGIQDPIKPMRWLSNV